MDAKSIILEHLESMADADANFKKRFDDETKNMDDCMIYIATQAMKCAINHVAALSDDEVFGLAAHYYQEKDIKVEPAAKCSIQTIKKEKKVTKPKALELDLFGGGLL